MAVQNRIRIGDVLKQYGYVTDEQVEQALSYQKINPGLKLGDIFVELGFVTERQKLDALGQRLSLPVIDTDSITFDIEAVRKIPFQLASDNEVIAFGISPNNCLRIVVSDPMNIYGIEEIRQTVGMPLEQYLADKKQIIEAINFQYSEVRARQAAETANGAFNEEEIEEINIDDSGDDAPIIKLVTSLIVRGYNTGASDIHIEPFEDKTLVRMRIDGSIVDYVTLQTSVHQSVIARIKIMSNLDIAEKRVPQDGHFRTKIDGQNINVRVSVIPTVFGEKAVMRLLASKSSIDHAGHFGMSDEAYARFAPMLKSPNGIIYITGPTGSGKSTTLYMVLESLAKRNVNISTIEDPVEKNVERVNQMQVNNLAGVTFEVGLRALLRQDPDIIMVGETRDAETASISVRAAITGHLVVSSLHTNDAVSSIVRLEDMGIEPYLVSNSLVGLVAQRLMRKVCPHCGKLVETTPEEKAFLGEDVSHVKKAVGCNLCNGTGYSGRIAIHEIAVIDRKARELIADGASINDISDYMVKVQGMKTLRQSGTELVKDGITTMDELIKVAYRGA